MTMYDGSIFGKNIASSEWEFVVRDPEDCIEAAKRFPKLAEALEIIGIKVPVFVSDYVEDGTVMFLHFVEDPVTGLRTVDPKGSAILKLKEEDNV